MSFEHPEHLVRILETLTLGTFFRTPRRCQEPASVEQRTDGAAGRRLRRHRLGQYVLGVRTRCSAGDPKQDT